MRTLLDETFKLLGARRLKSPDGRAMFCYTAYLLQLDRERQEYRFFLGDLSALKRRGQGQVVFSESLAEDMHERLAAQLGEGNLSTGCHQFAARLASGAFPHSPIDYLEVLTLTAYLIETLGEPSDFVIKHLGYVPRIQPVLNQLVGGAEDPCTVLIRRLTELRSILSAPVSA